MLKTVNNRGMFKQFQHKKLEAKQSKLLACLFYYPPPSRISSCVRTIDTVMSLHTWHSPACSSRMGSWFRAYIQIWVEGFVNWVPLSKGFFVVGFVCSRIRWSRVSNIHDYLSSRYKHQYGLNIEASLKVSRQGFEPWTFQSSKFALPSELPCFGIWHAYKESGKLPNFPKNWFSGCSSTGCVIGVYDHRFLFSMVISCYCFTYGAWRKVWGKGTINLSRVFSKIKRLLLV